MDRNKLIAVIVIVVVAGVGIWWWQSSGTGSGSGSGSESVGEQIKDGATPEIEVLAVNVSNIDEEQIDATGEVRISNPFPVEMSTNRIDYEIFIDSIRVIKDAYEEPLTIASSDSTVIEMPMKILADPMKRVFDYFEEYSVDSADYAINLIFHVDVPVAGEQEFSMEMSRRMPAFRLMEVELQNFDPNILSSDEGIDLVVQITNNNIFPLELKNATFYLTLEEELEVSGEMEDYVHIPAKGTGDVAISARKERGSFTQAGLSALFDQEGTGFHYVFSYAMDSDNNMFDDTEMETNISGTLDEITGAL